MRLRDPKQLEKPDLVIVPMIDIMFFLLVFFMISTMYMTDLKTIPVKLPKASHAMVDSKTTFAVTVKKDGSIYVGDQPSTLDRLVRQAQKERNAAIVIRADEDVEYSKVIALVDQLKGAGISRFGLATGNGE